MTSTANPNLFMHRHSNFINAIHHKLVDDRSFAWNVRENHESGEALSDHTKKTLLKLQETSGGPLSLLCKNLRRVRHVLLELEKFPCHDGELDEDTHAALAEYGEFTIFLDMAPLKTRLQNSLEQLELAQESIFGILRGDEKDKMEAALARHCRQTEALIALSEELSTRHGQLPRKPFQIRRVMMANLLLACRTTISLMEEISEVARAEELEYHLTQDFEVEISKMRKLRATIAKLRDNPSQKMTATLSDCISRSDAIVEAVTAVGIRANEIDQAVRAAFIAQGED